MQFILTVEFDGAEDATSLSNILSALQSGETKPKKATTKKPDVKVEQVQQGAGTPVVNIDPLTDLTGSGETNNFVDISGVTGETATEDSLDSFLGGGSPAVEKKILTREELRQKAATIAGKSDPAKKAVIALIKKSGVTDLTQLPEAKFAEFNVELDKIK